MGDFSSSGPGAPGGARHREPPLIDTVNVHHQKGPRKERHAVSAWALGLSFLVTVCMDRMRVRGSRWPGSPAAGQSRGGRAHAGRSGFEFVLLPDIVNS